MQRYGDPLPWTTFRIVSTQLDPQLAQVRSSQWCYHQRRKCSWLPATTESDLLPWLMPIVTMPGLSSGIFALVMIFRSIQSFGQIKTWFTMNPKHMTRTSPALPYQWLHPWPRILLDASRTRETKTSPVLLIYMVLEMASDLSKLFNLETRLSS